MSVAGGVKFQSIPRKVLDMVLPYRSTGLQAYLGPARSFGSRSSMTPPPRSQL